MLNSTGPKSLTGTLAAAGRGEEPVREWAFVVAAPTEHKRISALHHLKVISAGPVSAEITARLAAGRFFKALGGGAGPGECFCHDSIRLGLLTKPRYTRCGIDNISIFRVKNRKFNRQFRSSSQHA